MCFCFDAPAAVAAVKYNQSGINKTLYQNYILVPSQGGSNDFDLAQRATFSPTRFGDGPEIFF